MADDEYELLEPFNVDGDELTGIRPQVIFALGVEWEMVRCELDSGRAVVRTIHRENAERIEKMCQRRGRSFEIEPCPHTEDQWSYLRVEAM